VVGVVPGCMVPHSLSKEPCPPHLQRVCWRTGLDEVQGHRCCRHALRSTSPQ
jgi:hypothetical protein